MIFPQSKLALELFTGLKGLEIGASAQNPFNLDTVKVDSRHREMWDAEQRRLGNEPVVPDFECEADALPFPDDSFDFVINAHVIEHLQNPIKALLEWIRVVRPGGMIYITVPHPDRQVFEPEHIAAGFTPDNLRPETKPGEVARKYFAGVVNDASESPTHYHVWRPDSFREFLSMLENRIEIVLCQDPDDKVGNGFTYVIKKRG